MSSPFSPLRRRALAAGLLAALAAPAGSNPSSAQALLAASDAVRNPSTPFAVTVTLIEYRQGKQVDSSVLTAWSKAAADGQFRTLIRIVEPARDLNKLMLKNGNDLWFFDPASQASIRLSPQQRLLGQASNGDVVTVNMARDYAATLAGEEEVVDGERVKRRAKRLDLKAVSPDVTYHRVELWIDADDAQPIRARFYSESDRLLKTAFYRKFAPQLGRPRPTEVVIIDGIDTAWVTVMRYGGFAAREIPDAWFQRDFLPRFKPE